MRRLSSPSRRIICALALLVAGLATGLATTASTASSTAPKAPGDDLLEVDQAFTVSAEFRDAKTIILTYRIAPGYYMYRKRFKFVLAENKPGLQAAQIPAGKLKQDATFGRVEIYRDSVRILLPLKPPKPPKPLNADDNPQGDAAETFELLATSQGCADAGVCYPPQTHHFKLHAGQSAIVLPESSGKLPFSTPRQGTAASKLLAPK